MWFPLVYVSLTSAVLCLEQKHVCFPFQQHKEAVRINWTERDLALSSSIRYSARYDLFFLCY